MSDPYHPASDGAQTDFSDDMSYGDYLRLDRILTAQHPRSDAHDEFLFIVQHQTSELWMRLALHELTAARAAIEADTVEPAFKMLSRVARIFEQLNSAWDVLRTMTPSEYTMFRPSLINSSGFQSAQYREIEFLLGNRNPAMLAPHAHDVATHDRLVAALATQSLYDAALTCVHRAGIDIPDAVRTRDYAQPYRADPGVEAAWAKIYSMPEAHWTLYQLAEKLVDLEDYFRRWRFNHVTTVQRIIGAKRGTGGTSGVGYLRRMLDVVLFPELWDVRTAL